MCTFVIAVRISGTMSFPRLFELYNTLLFLEYSFDLCMRSSISDQFAWIIFIKPKVWEFRFLKFIDMELLSKIKNTEGGYRTVQLTVSPSYKTIQPTKRP